MHLAAPKYGACALVEPTSPLSLSGPWEAALRFSVLGPLAAEGDDGSRLVLGRPSQRGTLAVLLLHAGQLPTRTLLIDALWGEHPPAEADTALRVRMRDLRRALAGHDRLLTHQSGYRIMVEPGELDADGFASLAAHGRAALDTGSGHCIEYALDGR